MIVDRKIGDILAGTEKHIAFAVNDSYKQAGFSEMSSDEEAQNAIKELNGKDIDGRAITIKERYNQAGFAGMIVYTCWPELATDGPHCLNTVLTHETTRHDTTKRIFHALVVHSMDRRRWAGAPDRIESCLYKIRVPSDEVIAMVAIGTSEFDQSRGANPEANMRVMERSPKKIVLYGLE